MTYQGMKKDKIDKKIAKQRHQIKSQWYYTFWGTATIAVVLGQVYVGSGYRKMSNSFNNIINTIGIALDQGPQEVSPWEGENEWCEEGFYYPTNPPTRIY